MAQAKRNLYDIFGVGGLEIGPRPMGGGFRTKNGSTNLSTMKNNWKQGERVRFEKNAWNETKAHKDTEASPKARASRGVNSLKKKALKNTKPTKRSRNGK